MCNKCRNDVRFHLPPWSTILRLPMYHGNISKNAIETIMKDVPIKSYLLSNFDPQMAHGSFIVSIKDIHGTYHTSALGFTLQLMSLPTMHFVHKATTDSFDKDHKNYICDFYEKSQHPILRKSPFSLKELCRAAMCDALTYEQLSILINIKLIPSQMYEYLTERLLVTQPANKDILICENFRESNIARQIFDPFHINARKRKLLCLYDM